MGVYLLSEHFSAAKYWNDPRDDGGSIVPRTGKSKRKLSGILVIESSKSFVGFAVTAPNVLFTNSHPLPRIFFFYHRDTRNIQHDRNSMA